MFLFSFVSGYFLISSLISSVIHWSFSSILFSLHVALQFFFFPLQLISNLIALWLEKMPDTISAFLNLSRLALWLSMWSVLVNVPCSLEKNVYSAAFAWNALCCCPVAQLCPTLCNPVDCSTPGFPVLHYLQEFAPTHVHWVDDATQPPHPVTPFSYVSSPPNVSFKSCVSLLIFLSEWSVCWCKWGIKFPHCYCVIVNYSIYVS